MCVYTHAHTHTLTHTHTHTGTRTLICAFACVLTYRCKTGAHELGRIGRLAHALTLYTGTEDKSGLGRRSALDAFGLTRRSLRLACSRTQASVCVRKCGFECADRVCGCRNPEQRQAHNTVYDRVKHQILSTTVARLLTCLARCAIPRGGRRRVAACQTANVNTAHMHAHAAMSIGSAPFQHHAQASQQSPDLIQAPCASSLSCAAIPASQAVQLPAPGAALYLPVPPQPDVRP